MRAIPVLLLICAVDWQAPGGPLHVGSFVYQQADAQALVIQQQIDYPTYVFNIRCK